MLVIGTRLQYTVAQSIVIGLKWELGFSFFPKRPQATKGGYLCFFWSPLSEFRAGLEVQGRFLGLDWTRKSKL
jgi:hypothetical protein